MKKIKVTIVAGARPNFMKIAPLMKEFRNYSSHFQVKLVHTGQHYDFQMSEVFFKELGIPKPDVHLNVGSASHAIQTAKIMESFEKFLLADKPDLVVVVGDVNSTLACSLVSTKLNIKVAHVEAGLRSFDRNMPEEINRIVTDSLSDYFFVSEPSGLLNLKKEGVDQRKIFFVGNIMIDTLFSHIKEIDHSSILKKLALSSKDYAVLTLHRPSNVDSSKSLKEIYDILKVICQKIKIIYPIHPRARGTMDKLGFLRKLNNLKQLIIIDPIGYVDFIKLVKNSRFIITDSGGIQEETTVLKVPCLTMRENTERPVTIKEGTNYLVGRKKKVILKCIDSILNNHPKCGKIPRFWDGKTANRIIRVFLDKL